MCEPLTATVAGSTVLTTTGSMVSGAAMSALTSGIGLLGQMSQQNQQSAYQDQLAAENARQMEENKRLANLNAANELAQINTQDNQRHEQASLQITDNAIKAAEARSTARVASGEAGVAGLSVDALEHDFSNKEARFKDAVKRGVEGGDLAARDTREAIELTRVGRIASIQPYVKAPVSEPSYIGAALRVVGGAGSAYFDTLKPRVKGI